MSSIVRRENNKYKKHLKWHVVTTHCNCTISEWFRTEKEAIKAQQTNEQLINSLAVTQEGEYTNDST